MRNSIINIDYLVLIFIWFMIEYGSVRLIITPCQNSNERLKTKSVGAAIIVRVLPRHQKYDIALRRRALQRGKAYALKIYACPHKFTCMYPRDQLTNKLLLHLSKTKKLLFSFGYILNL